MNKPVDRYWHRNFSRFLGLFLSLALSVPNPAYALRQNQPETKEQRTGLEEALLSKNSPMELFQRATTALGLSPSKTNVPTPGVSPRSSSVTVPSAAGAEEIPSWMTQALGLGGLSKEKVVRWLAAVRDPGGLVARLVAYLRKNPNKILETWQFASVYYKPKEGSSVVLADSFDTARAAGPQRALAHIALQAIQEKTIAPMFAKLSKPAIPDEPRVTRRKFIQIGLSLMGAMATEGFPAGIIAAPSGAAPLLKLTNEQFVLKILQEAKMLQERIPVSLGSWSDVKVAKGLSNPDNSKVETQKAEANRPVRTPSSSLVSLSPADSLAGWIAGGARRGPLEFVADWNASGKSPVAAVAWPITAEGETDLVRPVESPTQRGLDGLSALVPAGKRLPPGWITRVRLEQGVSPSQVLTRLREEISFGLMAQAVSEESTTAVLAIEAGVISQRPGLAEFIRRTAHPEKFPVVTVGRGSLAAEELAGVAGLTIVRDDDYMVELALALSSIEKASHVVYVGDPQQALILSRILPASMHIDELDPGAGLDKLLLSLGFSPSIFEGINAAEAEKAFARLYSA